MLSVTGKIETLREAAERLEAALASPSPTSPETSEPLVAVNPWSRNRAVAPFLVNASQKKPPAVEAGEGSQEPATPSESTPLQGSSPGPFKEAEAQPNLLGQGQGRPLSREERRAPFRPVSVGAAGNPELASSPAEPVGEANPGSSDEAPDSSAEVPPAGKYGQEKAASDSATGLAYPTGGAPSEGPAVDEGAPLGERPMDEIAQPRVPQVTVKVTAKGCTPRVDLLQNRVVMQTKSLTFSDGTLVHETPCGDSHQWYPLKKDWACPEEVEKTRRVAYSCYRRYWEKKGKGRIYVDRLCQRDESQPHPLMDETAFCHHVIHLSKRQAHRQVQTVYYNRANARQVVVDCHPTAEPPLPLVDTRHGCKPLHQIEKNVSVLQKRTVFTDQGRVHEVLPCRPSEETVPHVFVKGGCRSTFIDGQFYGFGKRQISLEGKKTLVSDTCEPLPAPNLAYTSEGCEGQWEQDFEAGRCYQKVRWYYQGQGYRKFLTGCIRADLFYPNRLEIGSYEHEDQKRRSKPIYKVFFEKDTKQHYVTLYAETDETKFIAHVCQGSWSYVTDVGYTNYASGSFGGTEFSVLSSKASRYTWRRPDGSTYDAS